MEEMNRQNARRITIIGGKKLVDVVNELLNYQTMGESVVADFNGHDLYSCDVTMDGAYLEVTGMTKSEYDEARKKWIEEQRLVDIKEEEENKVIKEALSYSMGADLHEAWRQTRKKEDGTYEPRMKKSKDEKWNQEHGTDDVDIANLTFEELPSNWQYENLEAARVAIGLVFRPVTDRGWRRDNRFRY